MSTKSPAKSSASGNRAELEKERVKRQAKAVKNNLTPLKIYLVGYNLLSASLWGYLLFLTISSVVQHPQSPLASATPNLFTRYFASSSPILPAGLTNLVERLKGSYHYHNLGELTKYVQSLAVLEVVHSALGWVRSPVGTTGAQVFSRLWTVWGVVEAAPETHDHPLFTSMLFAWSATEVIRYTFYATSVLGITVPGLNWLRYTTFIPLYPLGASSEAFLSFSTLPKLSSIPWLPTWLTTFSPLSSILTYLPPSAGKAITKSSWGRALLWNVAKAGATGKKAVGKVEWGLVEYARLALFFIWWPALYVLYTHMFAQRRKVVGAGRTLKAKTQ